VHGNHQQRALTEGRSSTRHVAVLLRKTTKRSDDRSA
jgi:hypothetical protein